MRSQAKPDPYAHMGQAVKARRQALNLSQTEAGDLAGCGRLFVSWVEQGKPTLRLDKLIDLMHALGLQFALMAGSHGIEVKV